MRVFVANSLMFLFFIRMNSLVEAANKDWLANPPGTELNDSANWNPDAPGANDTGFFNVSSVTMPTLTSGNINVGGYTFNPGASTYNFDIQRIINFFGTGVNNNSAVIQTITASNTSTILFQTGVTANNGATRVNYVANGGSYVIAQQNSNSGNSNFLINGGNISFLKNNPGNALTAIELTNSGTLTLATTDLTLGSLTTDSTVNLNYAGTFLHIANLLDIAGIAVGSNTELQANAVGIFEPTANVSGIGNIQIDSGAVLNFNEISDIYGGDLTGSGALSIGGDLIFTGNNLSFLGDTTIQPNASLTGTSISIPSGNILDNGHLIYNQGTNDTISANISGSGDVTFDGGATYTVTGMNTYSGGTFIQNNSTVIGTTTTLQGDIVDNAHLIFSQGTTGTFAGNISGSGDVLFDNGGTFILTGNNSYSGGTVLLNGSTVEGDTNSLQGDILINAGTTLEFNQLFTDDFNGTLTGSGNLSKVGTGNLIFDTDQSGFSGFSSITEGTFTLEAPLGGDLSLSQNGTLIATSSVLGNVDVSGNGTLFIPSANDIFNVGGNYTQTGGTLEPTVNGQGQSSLLNVVGSISVSGDSTLLVDSDDGIFARGTNYLVAHGSSISGTFSSVLTTNPALRAQALYTANDIFVTFGTSFIDIALTFNEFQVAAQLDALTNPNASELAVINALLALSTPDAVAALNQMTGEQYATSLWTAEFENEQFLRQLYDPLRSFIGDPSCFCCCSKGLQYWASATGGHARHRGNQDADPTNLEDYSVAVGLQRYCSSGLLVGGALTYSRENIRFENIGGRGENNALIGGLYGLYRSSCYYALGELAVGYSHENVHREINLGTLNFAPRGSLDVFQSTLYLEAGRDFLFRRWRALPFIALEGGHYSHGTISEQDGGILALTVSPRTYGSGYSHLGLHLTSPRFCNGIYLGIDGAWQYRLSSTRNYMTTQFSSFGTSFPIHGYPLNRNLFDGDLFVAKKYGCGDFFIRGGAHVGSRFHAYDLTLGLTYAW